MFNKQPEYLEQTEMNNKINEKYTGRNQKQNKWGRRTNKWAER